MIALLNDRPMIGTIGKAIKRAALGDLPQQCTMGMPDPQREVRIWLEGLGDPIDITNNHVVACASPFIVGIGLDPERTRQTLRMRLSLKFRERDGDRRLLAKVRLRSSGSVTIADQALSLFHIRSCNNYCLTRPRLWAYDLYQSFKRWRRDKNPEIPMSVLGARSMNVFFICPRPVVLVSAMDGSKGNIFPMNLFGCIGDDYFAFALNSLRKAAPLVERAGRVALSSIPIEHAGLVRQLGKNHRSDFAEWDKLPFATTPSPALGLPIPQFALRVREMEIKTVQKLGSHTLFLARLIRDEHLRNDLQFCMIHGIYQSWRLSMLRNQPIATFH
jgi:flavin reductase (DIM6/NTAB) family NADH-FMN oxidoreductase RutF